MYSVAVLNYTYGQIDFTLRHTHTVMSNSKMKSFRSGIKEKNSDKLKYDNFDCFQNDSTRQNL